MRDGRLCGLYTSERSRLDSALWCPDAARLRDVISHVADVLRRRTVARTKQQLHTVRCYIFHKAHTYLSAHFNMYTVHNFTTGLTYFLICETELSARPSLVVVGHHLRYVMPLKVETIKIGSTKDLQKSRP